MKTSSARTARASIAIGASLAVAASGLTALAAPVANASGAHIKAAAAGVHTSGLRSAAAPAGSVGQGPLTSSCTVSGGRTSCDIWAKIGAVTVHNSASTTKSIPVWNFVPTANTTATGGSALLIGQVGVPMDITLHNTLATNVGLGIPQADGFYGDTTGIAQGASKTYTITPQRAGTYIYEAALTPDGDRQVAMGLAGALVVRPAANSTTAYDTLQSSYDDEAMLVYSDVDENLAADPFGFNMRNYVPQYHLINGVSYPDGSPIVSDAGRTVALHMVNTSQLDKSPTILGNRMSVFAKGAREIPTVMNVTGRVLVSGDTMDASVLMPAGQHRYAIYSTWATLNNGNWINGVNSPALGGGIAMIQSGGSGTVAPTGPAISKMAAAGQPGGIGRPLTVSMTLDTANRGGGDIQQAEYWIDTLPGAPGSGTQVAVSGTSALAASFPVDVSALTTGIHNVYVRAQDTFGAWGPTGTLGVKVDANGPVVSNPVLDGGNISTNGTAPLAIAITVSDATTGGSNVIATRYWIDGSATPPASPSTLTTNGPRVTAAGSGSIPANVLAGLTEGAHTIYAQGQDSLGQWGAVLPIPFVVDRTAPTTTNVVMAPGVTNGVTTNPAVPGSFGITADVVDPLVAGVNSPLTNVEAFICAPQVYYSTTPNGTACTPGPQGTTNALDLLAGGPGAAPGSTHYVGNMPLAWVGGYIAKGGDIPVWVIGVDAAGNRVNTAGMARNTHLLIDTVKPTASGTLTQGTWTLEQNYTADASATLAVTTADAAPSGGVAKAEYFIGADPGYGNGTAITLVAGAGTATLNLNTLGATDATWLKGGSHTVNVRALDAAGNWGPTTAVTATLKPVTVFASGWETPTNGTFGWTGTSNNGSTITSSTSGPIAGSRSLSVVTTATSTGYQYQTVPVPPARGQVALPAIGTQFSAHATIAPGTTTTAGVRVLSLAAATASGDFAGIEYRRTAGGVVSFRIGSTNGAASATPTLNFSGWTTVTAATNYVIVLNYTQGNPGGVTATVNGTAITTATRNTSNYGVGTVRVGALTSPGVVMTIKVDSFSSARAPF
jgi:hypothetical protein